MDSSERRRVISMGWGWEWAVGTNGKIVVRKFWKLNVHRGDYSLRINRVGNEYKEKLFILIKKVACDV